MSDPLRRVVRADAYSGVTGFLGYHKFRSRWWELELECGHREERPIRNEPGATKGKRGYALQHHPVPPGHELPPPQRVRCYECGRTQT